MSLSSALKTLHIVRQPRRMASARSVVLTLRILIIADAAPQEPRAPGLRRSRPSAAFDFYSHEKIPLSPSMQTTEIGTPFTPRRRTIDSIPQDGGGNYKDRKSTR